MWMPFLRHILFYFKEIVLGSWSCYVSLVYSIIINIVYSSFWFVSLYVCFLRLSCLSLSVVLLMPTRPESLSLSLSLVVIAIRIVTSIAIDDIGIVVTIMISVAAILIINS